MHGTMNIKYMSVIKKIYHVYGYWTRCTPGSLLGLLLFLLYINDLPKNVHDAKVVMFADDTSVLISDSDARELQIKIDRVVTELENWLNRNDLVINTGKTGVMSFHNGQPHFLAKPFVTFNNTTGLHIRNKISWYSNNRFTKMALPYSVISK